MIDTLLTHPISQVTQATAVVSAISPSDTVTNCIIATVVYVLQRGLLKLWDKYFSKTKHYELGKK